MRVFSYKETSHSLGQHSETRTYDCIEKIKKSESKVTGRTLQMIKTGQKLSA